MRFERLLAAGLLVSALLGLPGMAPARAGAPHAGTPALVATNASDNNLDKIDTSSGQAASILKYPLEVAPTAVTYYKTKQGHVMALATASGVTQNLDGVLNLVDLTAGTATTLTIAPAYYNVSGLVMLPDGSGALFTVPRYSPFSGNYGIFRYNFASGVAKEINNTEQGANGMAFWKNRDLWVCNYYTIDQVDPKTGAVLTSVAMPQPCSAMAYNAKKNVIDVVMGHKTSTDSVGIYVFNPPMRSIKPYWTAPDPSLILGGLTVDATGLIYAVVVHTSNPGTENMLGIYTVSGPHGSQAKQIAHAAGDPYWTNVALFPSF